MSIGLQSALIKNFPVISNEVTGKFYITNCLFLNLRG